MLRPDDEVVVIGASETQAQVLRDRYGLKRLRHHNPPMGFFNDPREIESTLDFIEAHSPFRICMLAVGSPQQEFLAHQLMIRGRALGLALCVGASINFITGVEKRAPGWLQQIGFEWAYRLLQQPRRLASRYLVRGPRIFALLARTEIRVRLGWRPPAATHLVSRIRLDEREEKAATARTV